MSDTARRTAHRSVLVIPVGDLLRRPGSTRDEVRSVVLDGLRTSTATVPAGAPVEVRAHLEAVNEGIVLTGEVRTTWTGECRRCLCPIERALVAPVLEVFEANAVDGETRPLGASARLPASRGGSPEVDLEPVAREAVLLELPLAPLCAEDCRGLCDQCGADRNQDPDHAHEAPADPRWSGLDALHFE